MKTSQRSRPGKFARYAVASSAALGAAAAAKAQFSGAYAIPNSGSLNGGAENGSIGQWTGTTTIPPSTFATLNTSSSPTSISLSFSGDNFTEAYSLTTGAVAAVAFGFHYVTSSTGFPGSVYVNYLVDGTSTSLPLNGSGDISFVTPTSSFGFQIGTNYTFGPGAASLTISNFSATAIPEPATTAGWMGAGALGLLAMRAMRRRRASAARV